MKVQWQVKTNLTSDISKNMLGIWIENGRAFDDETSELFSTNSGDV